MDSSTTYSKTFGEKICQSFKFVNKNKFLMKCHFKQCVVYKILINILEGFNTTGFLTNSERTS